MNPSPLISASELRALMSERPVASANLLVLDARFNLADPAAGESDWASGHIPGALHAHLDRDLSGPRTGSNGRHPLPTLEAWQRTVRGWGLEPDTHVVVTDGANGMFAARLWWMLRHWSGHAGPVQVLDGGLQAWAEAGGPLSANAPVRAASRIHLTLNDRAVVSIEEVSAWVQAQSDPARRGLLLDARAPDRFRGEHETLDPVGGHIPGAHNHFFQNNLQADHRFQPASVLRQRHQTLLTLNRTTASDVVHQCGSGVTACHNLLAMEHAGLTGSRLFVGSWSQWCADPQRPVER